jgi:hypothetical protein
MKRTHVAVWLAAAIASVAIAAAGAAEPAAKNGGYAIGDRLQSRADRTSPSGGGAYREAKWEDLIPKDWDPLKDLRKLDFGRLDDADPRATLALDRMREIWDKAPINPALDGATVKLPGFVVPLEQTKSGLREFLLVPYFGACIHVPPPPANQIVHVFSKKPIRDVHAMTAVWVSGTLKTERANSTMGMSGYRMEASRVERYEDRGERR